MGSDLFLLWLLSLAIILEGSSDPYLCSFWTGYWTFVIKYHSLESFKSSVTRRISSAMLVISTVNLLQMLWSAMDKVPDRLCILLDGLDEYNSQKFELANFINSLCSD